VKRPRDLRDRALATLPGADIPTIDLVLFALGVATAVTVAVATGEQLLRVALEQRPPALAGEALAAAVGVAVTTLARGVDRASIWVVAVRAAALAGTFASAALTYAYVGRSALRDPLGQAGPAFASLLLGAAAGLAAGIVLATLVPAAPRARSTSAAVRAIGVAIVAGAIVHLFWPTSFFLAVAGIRTPDDLRIAAIELPELLAGPIAAGVYAARRGVGYGALLAVGVLLAVPSALAEVSILRGAAEANDPSLRRALALGIALLVARIAAWPLAAAFVHGFLTPPSGAPTVPDGSISET